jgi:amino acid transporter
MNLDITELKKQAFIFSPARILAIIAVMMLICILILMALDGGQEGSLYVLLLFMPCAICSLLLDVFLRILFRKDIKYKVLYIWVIEIVAMVIGIGAFLRA